MQRPYKITYKTYFNDRLKEVDFHGKKTHPLYIQITYRKKTIFFKSYYFDLLSSKRYEYKNGKKIICPQLNDLIDFELTLIRFVIEKLGGSITLETFKEAYNFYGHDLCSYVEKAIGLHLIMHFIGSGNPSFAWAVEAFKNTNKVLYDFLHDMKRLFTDDAWAKLVQYCNGANVPYIELYGFIMTYRKVPYYFLTVMEWEEGQILNTFKTYLESIAVGSKEQDRMIKGINKLVSYIKKEASIGFS